MHQHADDGTVKVQRDAERLPAAAVSRQRRVALFGSRDEQDEGGVQSNIGVAIWKLSNRSNRRT
jgi:hypothetical protein